MSRRIDRLEGALRHCLRTLERADVNFGSDREMDRAAWMLFAQALEACRVARRALGDGHATSVTAGGATVGQVAGFDVHCSCGWNGGRYVTRMGAFEATGKHGRFE